MTCRFIAINSNGMNAIESFVKEFDAESHRKAMGKAIDYCMKKRGWKATQFRVYDF